MRHYVVWGVAVEKPYIFQTRGVILLLVPWGEHLRYACGYRAQGKCYVKTRGRRRREGRITERRHERELDRRGQRWNRKYEKSTDTRNKKGTNLIYYCNTRTITEHGLRPVTLQDSVDTIIIDSDFAYTSPNFWGTWSSFKYLFPYTQPSRRQAVILGLGVPSRAYLLATAVY